MGLEMIYIEEEKYTGPNWNSKGFEVGFFRSRDDTVCLDLSIPFDFLDMVRNSHISATRLWDPVEWTKMLRKGLLNEYNNKYSLKYVFYSHILHHLIHHTVWVLTGGCQCLGTVVSFWLQLPVGMVSTKPKSNYFLL